MKADCHAELVSASHQKGCDLTAEILRQAQDDRRCCFDQKEKYSSKRNAVFIGINLKCEKSFDKLRMTRRRTCNVENYKGKQNGNKLDSSNQKGNE